MGLIFGESREEKQERKEMEMNEYIENLALEGLDPKEVDKIREIYCLQEMYHCNMGMTQTTNSLLVGLIEQNWLLMKKLESIDKKLEGIE